MIKAKQCLWICLPLAEIDEWMLIAQLFAINESGWAVTVTALVT